MTGRLIVIILMLCTSAATASDLGRLFFTPAQRATLDNARKQNLRIEIGTQKEPTPPPPRVPQNVSVDGLVRSSDGKSTVWLNNRPVTERSAGDIKVSTNKNDNRVRLSVPESGRSIDLKVGQTVEIVSGTIQEGYFRRPSPKPEAKAPIAENAAGPSQAPPAKPEEAAPKRESTQ